ncbi:expansin EXLX1 family cellulose-binding protein [Streptomyces sp. NPDC059894]|uniref:expansin EXLX1 family cellulose-binding protein n=1 Tax=unclassified Streptomyces TaxID=2593676 RepID=UPI003657C8AD
MASPSHRRSRRSRRTWRPAPAPALVVAVVAVVAAVTLVVSLVVAFRPGHGADGTREAAAGAVAGAGGTASPTASTPAPTPSTASPASPSPAAGRSTSPATRTAAPATASARSTAAGATRTPSAAAPLAGRIRPGVAREGVATSYDAGDGDGACSYGPADDLMVAAMNTADYETSKACGAHVLVRTADGASVTVRIVNECPAPCEPGQLDLSTQAFAELAPLSAGRVAITWSLLSPAGSDPVSIRYKTGSSRYWCGIQALGHRNPLARLEVRTGSGWTALTRTEYNYFLSEQGAGCGGALRVTDIYGERLTIDGIALRPETVQPTGVQFARH